MGEISIDEIMEGARKLIGSEAAVMRMGDKKKLKVPAQRTGLPQLDLALGVKGMPKGRIVEIFGPASSGKTTLSLTIAAQAQKKNGWVWIGDMEHALDPEWAEKLGVDMDKLLISQPDNGEQCLDLGMYMIKTGVIDLIIIDSVSALVPKRELEGESGDAVIGLQARLMSQAMRKMSPSISKTKCIAIFINQIREKIGIKFGSPETVSGGRALKFFAGVRIDIRNTGNEKDGEEIIGSSHKIKIVKNKVAPPFKICEAMLNFKSGFDLVENLFIAAVDKGIITKTGNTYAYENQRLGVGRSSSTKTLKSFDKVILDEIYDLILVDKTKEESKPEVIGESLKPVTDVIVEPKA